MMPGLTGFDVVEALQRDAATSRIPILVVKAKHISAQDRTALSRDHDNVIRIVEKAGFNKQSFIAEVRRALSSDKGEASADYPDR